MQKTMKEEKIMWDNKFGVYFLFYYCVITVI